MTRDTRHRDGSRLHGSRLMFIVAFAMAGCVKAGDTRVTERRLPVVASIPPLADFVRQVGGDRVIVETLVPPGASPHTYELTPAQLRKVSQARLLVLNGIGLEYWADEVISAAENPGLIVVTTSDGLEILVGDETEGSGNPHVWLSPRNAIHQVEAIRDALLATDPDGTEGYRARAEEYIEELQALDREIRQAVAAFSNREFIAFHPAWVYFARDYGLIQAGVVEAAPGREPSPEDIAAIVETARRIGARAIFAEAQFSPNAVEMIAEESGAQVLFLNPLGVPPEYDYLDMMRYNLGEMSKALR
jgi:ABC-type Zn uptake system ZnuABC Zn-binding protein ZnuA